MSGSTPFDGTGPEGLRRVDNGLAAPSYVPLTDVEMQIGTQILSALGRARIAAYLDPTPDFDAARRRLFVAAEERGDARTIVAAAVRGLGAAVQMPEPAREPADPLEGIDTDAAFAAMTADWHVDTVAAVREAERQLRNDEADWIASMQPPAADEPVWLDNDHYIPPPPPPLPRLAAPTIGAMALLAVSILLLGLGGAFGLATDLSMLLGVLGILVGAWILIMRLRDRPYDDDDGAVL